MQEEAFTHMGVNEVEVGVELHRALSLDEIDYRDPAKLNMLKNIASYLNDDIDPIFTIRTVMNSNKNPDRSNLEHLASFVHLQLEKREVQAKLERLEKELSFYG